MCTAITYAPHAHYFGRNLDLNVSYHEQVTITPRHYPFNFRRMGENANRNAMIGMATVVQDYPLYYEATPTFFDPAKINCPFVISTVTSDSSGIFGLMND